jgi:hypothetical protein
MKIALFCLLAYASSTAAQVLDGAEFDALSRGSTLYFTESGQAYGSEQFFSGHRTVWRAEDGRCINGKWTYKAPEICFVYDDGSGPFCWEVVKDSLGVTITSTRTPEDEPPLVLRLSRQDTQPILCTGPLFGVAYRP